MKPVSEKNRPEENEGQQYNNDEKEKAERKTEKPPKKGKKKTIIEKRKISSRIIIGKSIATIKNSGVFKDINSAFGHIHMKKMAIILGIGIFAVYLLTGIYVVNPGEQAVVKRFGKVIDSSVSEGIHYRLPSPIDSVQMVNIEEVRRADIGMSLPEHMHEEASESPQALQLLTGDENIVGAEAIVHYKVSDPQAFLYNVAERDEIIVRSAVEASLVQVISGIAVYDILGTQKVQAQNDVIKYAQGILDEYNAGILITAFNIQSIVPPDAVSEAFLDVTAAKEDKETAINNANGYYNSLIPEARGQASGMISEAEGYKTQAINQAQGDAAKFDQMLAEYQKNSQIYSKDTTKYRLFLETMDKILPNVKKYIVNSKDGSIDVKLLEGNIGKSTEVQYEN